MGNIAIYFWSVVVFLLLHILATTVIFLHLRSQLKGRDLVSYKRILGINYQRKPGKNGWTKFKWVIGFMVVRAWFDDNGKLKEYEISPYSFFPLLYKKTFGF